MENTVNGDAYQVVTQSSFTGLKQPKARHNTGTSQPNHKQAYTLIRHVNQSSRICNRLLQSVSLLYNMVGEEAISLSQESYLASLSTLPIKYSYHP
ncbi:hypothetical protein E2C01_054605 [Portunus trituberculatus]|uniref:Uncharacterized protein n=1 Tax=Portunus trituberculatus TaxID=210409 RepID=A0A5B7GSF6_PORTR|nr:hypothetical protein [Portunus trituberculatus]